MHTPGSHIYTKLSYLHWCFLLCRFLTLLYCYHIQPTLILTLTLTRQAVLLLARRPLPRLPRAQLQVAVRRPLPRLQRAQQAAVPRPPKVSYSLISIQYQDRLPPTRYVFLSIDHVLCKQTQLFFTQGIKLNCHILLSFVEPLTYQPTSQVDSPALPAQPLPAQALYSHVLLMETATTTLTALMMLVSMGSVYTLQTTTGALIPSRAPPMLAMQAAVAFSPRSIHCATITFRAPPTPAILLMGLSGQDVLTHGTIQCATITFRAPPIPVVLLTGMRIL